MSSLTKFPVNARNVCGLLNAIAPSSVTEFKDAALEYMCLNLEAMLQGGYVLSLLFLKRTQLTSL